MATPKSLAQSSGRGEAALFLRGYESLQTTHPFPVKDNINHHDVPSGPVGRSEQAFSSTPRNKTSMNMSQRSESLPGSLMVPQRSKAATEGSSSLAMAATANHRDNEQRQDKRVAGSCSRESTNVGTGAPPNRSTTGSYAHALIIDRQTQETFQSHERSICTQKEVNLATTEKHSVPAQKGSSHRTNLREIARDETETTLLPVSHDKEKTRISEASKQGSPCSVAPTNARRPNDESKTQMLQNYTEERLPREQHRESLSHEYGSRSSSGEKKKLESGELTENTVNAAPNTSTSHRDRIADKSRIGSSIEEKQSQLSPQTCDKNSTPQNAVSTNSIRKQMCRRDQERTGRKGDPSFRATTTSKHTSAGSPLNVVDSAESSSTIEATTMGPGSNKRFYSNTQSDCDGDFYSVVEEETRMSSSNVQKSVAEIASALPSSKQAAASIAETSSFADTETVLQSHCRPDDNRHQQVTREKSVVGPSPDVNVSNEYQHDTTVHSGATLVYEEGDVSRASHSQTKSRSYTSQRRSSVTSDTNTQGHMRLQNGGSHAPSTAVESTRVSNTSEIESRNRKNSTDCLPFGSFKSSTVSAKAHSTLSGRECEPDLSASESLTSSCLSMCDGLNQASQGKSHTGELGDRSVYERRYYQASRTRGSIPAGMTESGACTVEMNQDNLSHGDSVLLLESLLTDKPEGSSQNTRSSNERVTRLSRRTNSRTAEHVVAKTTVEKTGAVATSSKRVSCSGIDTTATRTNESARPDAQSVSERKSRNHSHSSPHSSSQNSSLTKTGLSNGERDRTKLQGSACKSTGVRRGYEGCQPGMEFDTVTKTTSRGPSCSASRHLDHGRSFKEKDSCGELQPPTPLIIQADSGRGETLNGSIHLSTRSGAFASQHSGENGTTFSASSFLSSVSEYSGHGPGLYASFPDTKVNVEAKSEHGKVDSQSAIRRRESDRDEKSIEGNTRENSKGAQTRTPQGELPRSNLAGSGLSESAQKRTVEKREEMSSERIESTQRRRDCKESEAREVERRSRVNADRSKHDEREARCSRSSMGRVESKNAETPKADMREASKCHAGITSTGTWQAASRPEEGMLNEKVRSSGDAENDKCVGAIRKSRISNKCPSADSSVASKGEWTKSHCPSSFTSSVSTTCTSTLSHSESHLSAMRESQTNQRESSRVLSESLSPPSSGPKSTTKRSTCPSSRQVEGLVKNVESLTREDSVRRDEAPDATAGAHLEETPDITAKLSDVCHSSRKSGSRSTEVQTPHDCETTGKSRGRKRTGSHSQETASLCDAKEGDKPRSLKARDGKKQSGSSGVGASLPLPQKRPTLKGSTVSTAEKTAMGKHLNSNAGLLFVPQIPPLPKALQHISLICTGDRENAELRALTQIQQSVMEHVTSQAMTQSAVVRLRIQRQLRTAGVSAADLENVEEYLVHKMPLTIAVDLLNVVPHLLEDNSYR
uniref:Proteophosphoglycan ppg4, related n=1 Tax=Toxoplasma gondii (strain ATCC 50861 / VEG) TaxID=432359 RepID=A0A0F7VA75_TOXGV|nr:TPA: hypothetical protein BN1205_071525 [Toxoplasma gondii VEG]